MTDKQIIIDGIDVAECQYLYFAIEDSIIDYKEYPRCSIGETFTNNACKNSNCYYKQLKRKEQECEELKKVNRHIEHNRTQKADKLMRIEKLIIACSTGYTDEFIQELLVILHEVEPIKE